MICKKKKYDSREDGDIWIPFAENILQTEGIKMKTRYEYERGFPEGLVVHYTAGWAMKKGIWIDNDVSAEEQRKLTPIARDYALRVARYGEKQGHNYLVMDVFGKLYQSRPLNLGGYHAGVSQWKGSPSVSRKFAGVEILNPGVLTYKMGKFLTWFGLEVPSKHVTVYNGKHFCKFTPHQEWALEHLCQWLVEASPDKVFNPLDIVGHHEVSPGRKDDPGGSLSYGMEELRSRILKFQKEHHNA